MSSEQKAIADKIEKSVAQAVPLPGIKGYLVATLALATALGIRWVLDPLWGDRIPYGTFFLAELAIVQEVGVGPFLFTVVGGFLLADWFFVPPRHSLLIGDQINQMNAVFFFLISALLLFFSLRARRARWRELLAEQARKRAEADREALLRELQTALANVKTLSGLLPICAHCKKIRDDKGYWNQIETYIRERSEAEFTHGICPDCIRQLYPHLLGPDVTAEIPGPP